MKLVRIGKLNNEKPAVLIHDKYFDVSDYIHDFNESFFENDGIRSLENIVSNNDLKKSSSCFFESKHKKRFPCYNTVV